MMESTAVKNIFQQLDYDLLHNVSLKKLNVTTLAKIDVLRRLVHSLKG